MTPITDLMHTFCSLLLALALISLLLPPTALMIALCFTANTLRSPPPAMPTQARTLAHTLRVATPTCCTAHITPPTPRRPPACPSHSHTTEHAMLPTDMAYNHAPSSAPYNSNDTHEDAHRQTLPIFLHTLPTRLDANAPIGEQIRLALATHAGLALCHSLNFTPDDLQNKLFWKHNHHTIKLTASASQLGLPPNSTLTAHIRNGLGGTVGTFPPAMDTTIAPRPTAHDDAQMQCPVCSKTFSSTPTQKPCTLLAWHWNDAHLGTPVPHELTSVLVACGNHDATGVCSLTFSKRGIGKHRAVHKTGHVTPRSSQDDSPGCTSRAVKKRKRNASLETNPFSFHSGGVMSTPGSSSAVAPHSHAGASSDIAHSGQSTQNACDSAITSSARSGHAQARTTQHTSDSDDDSHVMSASDFTVACIERDSVASAPSDTGASCTSQTSCPNSPTSALQSTSLSPSPPSPTTAPPSSIPPATLQSQPDCPTSPTASQHTTLPPSPPSPTFASPSTHTPHIAKNEHGRFAGFCHLPEGAWTAKLAANTVFDVVDFGGYFVAHSEHDNEVRQRLQPFINMLTGTSKQALGYNSCAALHLLIELLRLEVITADKLGSSFVDDPKVKSILQDFFYSTHQREAMGIFEQLKSALGLDCVVHLFFWDRTKNKFAAAGSSGDGRAWSKHLFLIHASALNKDLDDPYGRGHFFIARPRKHAHVHFAAASPAESDETQLLHQPAPQPTLHTTTPTPVADTDGLAMRIASHPVLMRVVPSYGTSAWVQASRKFLTSYLQAKDAGEKEQALIKLLLLPGKALRRLRGKRGKQTVFAKKRKDQLNKQIARADTELSEEHAPAQPANSSQPQQSKVDLKVARVMRHVTDGHLSRAARALSSPDIPRQTDFNTTSNMDGLHPPGPTPQTLPACPRDAPGIVPEEADILRTIRRMANGASPGPSGWTADLLLPLLNDPSSRKAICAIITDIRNGNLQGTAKQLLLASMLIGIPKPDGGTRPIAMGEVFYRIAATMAVHEVARDIGTKLSPQQLGVGVKDGPTVAALILQSLLAPHDDAITESGFALDISNAFNTIDRAHVMNEFFKRDELDTAHKIMHFSYSENTILWLRGEHGKIVKQMSSRQGVRQGDPLGSLSFAVALHPVICNTLEKFPQLKIVAIHDDCTICGPEDDVVLAAQHFSDRAKLLNLKVNPQKCCLIALHQRPISEETQHRLDSGFDEKIRVERDGTKVIGVPIGTSGYVQREALRIINNEKDTFDILRTCEKLPKQVRFLLLRVCSQTQLTYLTRCLPQKDIEDALTAFDKMVFDTATSITDSFLMPWLPFKDRYDAPTKLRIASAQATLPLKQGGLGIRLHHSNLSHTAYIGAIAQAAPYLLQARTQRQAEQAQVAPRLAEGLRNALEAYASLIPDNALNKLRTDRLLPKAHQHADSKQCLEMWAAAIKLKNTRKPLPKLQKALTSLIHNQVTSEINKMLDVQGLTRLAACSAKGASAALTAVPTEECLIINDEAFATLVQLRLGTLAFPTNGRSECTCKAKRCNQAENPEHFLSCPTLRKNQMNTRHDAIRETIAGIARLAGCFTETEPVMLHGSNNDHPDIFVIAGLQAFYVDITVRSPICPSLIDGAKADQALDTTKLLETAEKSKSALYADLCSRSGIAFLPLALNPFGQAGAQTKDIFKAIAERADGDPGLGLSFEKTYRLLQQATGVALANCNYECRLACLRLAAGHKIGGKDSL